MACSRGYTLVMSLPVSDNFFMRSNDGCWTTGKSPGEPMMDS